MTEIKTLLKGAIEKGIGAKPSVGDYSIDIDYIKDGVKYTLINNSNAFVTITRDNKRKFVSLDFFHLPFQKKDTVDILTVIENKLNDYKIFL
jgi:hypothetical protein